MAGQLRLSEARRPPCRSEPVEQGTGTASSPPSASVSRTAARKASTARSAGSATRLGFHAADALIALIDLCTSGLTISLARRTLTPADPPPEPAARTACQLGGLTGRPRPNDPGP